VVVLTGYKLTGSDSLYPNLFTSTPDPPAPPETSIALPTILAAAPTLQNVSSQLLSLSESPSAHGTEHIVPPTASLATWAALTPKIAQLDATQEAQTAEIARLRVKSAQLVSRWYEVQMLAAGRVWVEWEGRVKKCEREVGRREGIKREEG
jgi:hypothetical protein